MDGLSDVAWRVFTRGLMWCVDNGTDGAVPEKYLRWLHPDGEQESAYVELVKAGVWKRTPAGYQFIDWDGALGQTTAERLEAYQRNGRERQRKYREKEHAKLVAKVSTSEQGKGLRSSLTTGDDTRDVTRDVGLGEGEGEGTDREVTETVNSDTGEVSWPVVEIPKTEWAEDDSGEFKERPVDTSIFDRGPLEARSA